MTTSDSEDPASADEEMPLRLAREKPGVDDEPEEPVRPMWFRVLSFLLSDTCRCLHTFVMLAFFCIILYPLYKYCVPCLFLEILITACLCPYFNVLNIPLWASIVVLIYGGYTLDWGDFEIAWMAHRH